MIFKHLSDKALKQGMQPYDHSIPTRCSVIFFWMSPKVGLRLIVQSAQNH